MKRALKYLGIAAAAVAAAVSARPVYQATKSYLERHKKL